MLDLLKIINEKHIIISVNIVVFSFFFTVLSFKKGYSYVPMLLAIISFIYVAVNYLLKKQKFVFDRDDKLLIFSFIAYFCSFLISVMIHADGVREIDNPSRVLLFIPLILFFTHFPVNIKTLLYGIPTGATVVGLLAICQKFILNLPLPFPEIMRIQAGNIAVTLASMSLVIAIYWGIKKHYKLMALTVIAACLGILASALSGARGGWIGLPAVIAIILYFAYQHLNKKIVFGILASLLLSATAIISIPQTNVAKRIDIAYQEVNNFFEKNHRDTSLGARFDMWNSALLGIKEKPILGWGSQGYQALKKEQFSKRIIDQNSLKFHDAHNQYLDSWIKRGISGLIGFLLVLFIPMFLFSKYIRDSSLEIKVSAMLGVIFIVSTMFYSLSQTFLAHNSGSLFYFFFIIILYSCIKNSIKLDKSRNHL